MTFLYLHQTTLHYILGMLGRVLLAAVLGGLIGYERERHERPAGLRTHMLVCIGSALLSSLDLAAVPQIVTGVGFLGAGTILRDSGVGGVRGLTTAASVWTVAAIGIAAGFGFPDAWVAIGATLIAFFTLTGLIPFETFMNKRRRRQQINLLVETGAEPLKDLAAILQKIRDAGTLTHNLDFQDVHGGQKLVVSLTMVGATTRDDIQRSISGMPQVVNYEWND